MYTRIELYRADGRAKWRYAHARMRAQSDDRSKGVISRAEIRDFVLENVSEP